MAQTRFLFWNVNRKRLERPVAALADEHDADIVLLAEYPDDIAPVLRALNRKTSPLFRFHNSLCPRLKLFTTFPGKSVVAIWESDRYSFRRIRLPGRDEILLVTLHFQSKLHTSTGDQEFECTVLSRHIAEQEDRVGHRRTVIVGDFNMNPFELGMVAAGGLHATMSRSVAGRGARTVKGEQYRFLYNPMWGHLGDLSGPAGTYFYDGSGHVNYFWNVFDQVLIRPDLVDGFDPRAVKILTSVGSESLLSENGRPNQTLYSDHLPLLFAVNF